MNAKSTKELKGIAAKLYNAHNKLTSAIYNGEVTRQQVIKEINFIDSLIKQVNEYISHSDIK